MTKRLHHFKQEKEGEILASPHSYHGVTNEDYETTLQEVLAIKDPDRKFSLINVVMKRHLANGNIANIAMDPIVF